MLVLKGTVICSLVLTLPLVIYAQGQYAGDECILETTNEKAVCKNLDDCKYAINLLKSKQTPQHCGYGVAAPIVCCPFENKLKSYRKCIRYHAHHIRSAPRTGRAGVNRVEIIGGVRSLAEEFPHMAVLGYGDINNITWLCGGTLISEKFILTAAHCLYHRELGTVKLVRLGDLDLASTSDIAKPVNFNIAKIYKHPQYKPEFYYNDIALLELDKTVNFNSFIRPACLYPNTTLPDNLPTITGWGRTSFLGDPSTHLLKAQVEFVSYEDCAKTYSPPDQKLPNGIIDSIQVCAGDREGKDTCPGDSGGPIQIKYFDKEQLISYYTVIGVTSFGKGCGFKSIAGVYTRVAPYVPWIEDIVWKDEDLY